MVIETLVSEYEAASGEHIEEILALDPLSLRSFHASQPWRYETSQREMMYVILRLVPIETRWKYGGEFDIYIKFVEHDGNIVNYPRRIVISTAPDKYQNFTTIATQPISPDVMRGNPGVIRMKLDLDVFDEYVMLIFKPQSGAKIVEIAALSIHAKVVQKTKPNTMQTPIIAERETVTQIQELAPRANHSHHEHSSFTEPIDGSSTAHRPTDQEEKPDVVPQPLEGFEHLLPSPLTVLPIMSYIWNKKQNKATTLQITTASQQQPNGATVHAMNLAHVQSGCCGKKVVPISTCEHLTYIQYGKNIMTGATNAQTVSLIFAKTAIPEALVLVFPRPLEAVTFTAYVRSWNAMKNEALGRSPTDSQYPTTPTGLQHKQIITSWIAAAGMQGVSVPEMVSNVLQSGQHPGPLDGMAAESGDHLQVEPNTYEFTSDGAPVATAAGAPASEDVSSSSLVAL